MIENRQVKEYCVNNLLYLVRSSDGFGRNLLRNPKEQFEVSDCYRPFLGNKFLKVSQGFTD